MATLYPHGDYRRYDQGCRGEECQGACTRARSRKSKQRLLQIASGRPSPTDRVDPGFVVARLRQWTRKGYSSTQISRATGIVDQHVRAVGNGRVTPKFVLRKSDEAVRRVARIGIRQALREIERETKAQERIAVLRPIINGGTYSDAMKAAGLDARTVSRYIKEAGLVGLSYRARWRRCHELATAFNRYLSGQCTAYEAVRLVGMMATPFWSIAAIDRKAA